jgi:NADPH2:quinone reductase
VNTTVTMTQFGGPDVLRLEESLVEPPQPHEVEVEVKAIGVNPADAKMRAGFFGGEPPVQLGLEAAGVVTAVGTAVTTVQIGDEVIAFRAPGAYASTLVVPETAIVAKPASLSWEQAAGLSVVSTTAVHVLEATNVGDGDVVLVHGAAGGVGQMVLQLAALRGARVIGTSSDANADLVRELGAVHVAYGEGLQERVEAVAPGGVDVALDLAGTPEALQVSLDSVADRSRIATIVPSAAAAEAGIRRLGGGPGAEPGTEIRDAARAEIARLAGEGLVRVRVAKAFPLAEVAEAHRLIEGGHVDGKVILVP